MTTSSSSLSFMVGRTIAACDAAALSDATVHATRRALLDAIGVMLAATGLATDPQSYQRRALMDVGPSRLLSGGRASPASAALANGALGHALDYGDVFDRGAAHPNAALVPALMALADMRPDISLGAFIAAMAVGSDLACRLSLAPARPYELGGWYPPPLCGLIGASASAARLLGLDANRIVAAMGLAMLQATFPAAIKHDPASGLRGVREAFAAQGAVNAALLAAAGASGFAAPLEGEGGFFQAYGGGCDESVVRDGLGTTFLGDEVSFKPWPSCRGTHAYIEAALDLRPTLAIEEIVEIQVETGPVQAMLMEPRLAKTSPDNAIAAKFSIPFTIALALRDGAVTLDSFAVERLQDARLRSLADRVVDRPRPDWGRAEAASGGVTIALADGSCRSRQVMQALGHPDRPVSDDQLIDKFVDCVGRARSSPPQPAETAAEMILGANLTTPVEQILDACIGQA